MNTSSNETSPHSGIIIGIISVVIIILLLASCSAFLKRQGDNWEEEESTKFNQQLQKNPDDWSEEEKDRYNSFMKWENEQEKINKTKSNSQ